MFGLISVVNIYVSIVCSFYKAVGKHLWGGILNGSLVGIRYHVLYPEFTGLGNISDREPLAFLDISIM